MNEKLQQARETLLDRIIEKPTADVALRLAKAYDILATAHMNEESFQGQMEFQKEVHRRQLQQMGTLIPMSPTEH